MKYRKTKKRFVKSQISDFIKINKYTILDSLTLY
jgi:hypothetical protein